MQYCTYNMVEKYKRDENLIKGSSPITGTGKALSDISDKQYFGNFRMCITKILVYEKFFTTHEVEFGKTAKA